MISSNILIVKVQKTAFIWKIFFVSM